MSDSDSDDAEGPPLAPEGDMAGAMVSGAVTRLVINAVEAGEYDPYSLTQTRRLVDLVDLISDYTGKEGGKYKVSRSLGHLVEKTTRTLILSYILYRRC